MNRIIGKINPDQRHVTIWGAGFSGLILGYFLKDQGYSVTIYEKSNRIGGKIQTKRTGAGLALSEYGSARFLLEPNFGTAPRSCCVYGCCGLLKI